MQIDGEIKKLLKDFAQQINEGNFEALFVEAELRKFNYIQIKELHDVLLEAEVFDSTALRNKLLWEKVKTNLKVAEMHQDDPAMKDKYIVQFIRAYLGSRYGFELSEVIQFMIDNQDALGIVLMPDTVPGQSSIGNYIMLFYWLKTIKVE